MNIQLRNVPFSPPDMTEAEANEVRDAILSGWITTGPRTKKLEKKSLSMYTRKNCMLEFSYGCYGNGVTSIGDRSW